MQEAADEIDKQIRECVMNGAEEGEEEEDKEAASAGDAS